MIGSLLAHAKALSIAAPDYEAGLGKGLEAEVLFALAATAQADGARIVARNHRGEPIHGRFVMRGGPGNLGLPTDREGASYFEATYNGDQVFELHNSLELLGQSGQEHEVDVCAIWGSDADAVRDRGERKLHGPPAVGVEVKEFGLRTPVSKNIARAFFACVIEFIPTWAMRVQTLQDKGFTVEIWPPGREEYQFWILSTGLASGETKSFLKAYDIQLIDRLDGDALKDAVGHMTGRLNALAALRIRAPAAPGPWAEPKPRATQQPPRQIKPKLPVAKPVRLTRPRRIGRLIDVEN